MLRRSQRLAQYRDLLVGRECVFGWWGFSRCWCLASNVVQVIFAVYSEFGMLELPGLWCTRSVFSSHSKSKQVKIQSKVSEAYLRTIRRCSILLILPDFVKVILVELADETRKIAVFKVFGKNSLGEFLILPSEIWLEYADSVIGLRRGSKTYLQHHKTIAFVSPPNN